MAGEPRQALIGATVVCPHLPRFPGGTFFMQVKLPGSPNPSLYAVSMDFKALYAGWGRHTVLGFQATMAAMATAILTHLVQAGAILLCESVSPGWIVGIPETMRMGLGIAFLVFFVLPLFGILLSQVSGLGRRFSTRRGKARDGRREKQEVENS